MVGGVYMLSINLDHIFWETTEGHRGIARMKDRPGIGESQGWVGHQGGGGRERRLVGWHGKEGGIVTRV